MSTDNHNLQMCLPSDFRFDQDELWNNLVNSFKASVEKRDLLGIKNALGQIDYYTTTAKQYIITRSDPDDNISERAKKYFGILITPLFDFVTTLPLIDYTLQSRAAHIFFKISHKYQSRPSNIHFSFQKVFDLYNYIFIIPEREMPKSYPSQELTNFFLFFNGVTYYFDESDGDKLLEKYLDKIGSSESISFISTLTLLRFYPPTEQCFNKIFNHLIPLFESPSMIQYFCATIAYFEALYSFTPYHKYFDWRPYLHSIFKTISISLNSNVKILGDEISTHDDRDFKNLTYISFSFSKDTVPLISASFIPRLLVEFDEEKGQEKTVAKTTLSILKDLVSAFIPMITPKSKKPENCALFISCLIHQFSTFYNSIQKLKKAKNSSEKVDHLNISKEIIDEFVSIVLPFVQSALFNGQSSIQTKVIGSVYQLAQLSYDLTINALVPFCLNNMVDAEMTATSWVCFTVIRSLIPTMLNEEHIDENLGKIPQIIEASLERCKNSLLKNYYLGMSVLSEIAQYISIPAAKEMNSKLSIKQRMVANSMINSLEVIIKCHFEHNKPLTTDQSDNPYNNILTGNTLKDGNERIPSAKKVVKKSKKPENQEKDLDKRFDCYFACFDDSYIESIVIPNLLKQLKNASNASFLNTFTYKFTKYLSKAKPDLITRVLSPKLEESFIKSNITRKPFWAHLLASTFVSCPSLLEKIPHYVELVNSLLVIKEEPKEDKKDDDKDEDEIECNFKCAQVMVYELLTRVPGHNIIDWSNCESANNEIKWGAIYKKWEIHPKWYEIDQNSINSMVESIFNSIKPHLDKFESYTLKRQKNIIKVLGSFFRLFNMRGKIGQLTVNFNSNETFSKIEKTLFEFINQMLSKLKLYQSKEEILGLLSSAITSHYSVSDKYVQIHKAAYRQKFNCIHSDRFVGVKSSRFRYLLSIQQEVMISLFKYTYEVTPNVELILDNLLQCVESEFQSISYRSISIFEKISIYSKKIHYDFVLKNLNVLENPNKTEYQCKGAMLYLLTIGMRFIMENVELIIKFLKAIISLKFEKDWKITTILNPIVSTLEMFRSVIHIEESKQWRDFITEVVDLPRTIDERQFIFILRFIISQDPLPSLEIVRFIINSLRDQSIANHNLLTSCLSHILCKIKPIAPRSEFETVEQFQGQYKDLIPYVDKISIGFHCKPYRYTFYTGPSSFDNNNKDSKEYQQIRDLFINEIFNNEKVFADLFETFTLLHKKEDNPEYIKPIYQTWKGIGQVIRTSIVKYTKSLIFNVLDVNDLTKISPVHLAALCELVNGISRATKHWTAEERKVAIDEILVPFCTPLVRYKGNDSSSSCVKLLTTFLIGDWDYRRIQWFLSIIEKVLSECLTSKEKMNEIVLRSATNIAKILFSECGNNVNEEYIRIANKIVIPLFSDFKSIKLDFISIFASLVNCRLLLTREYHPEDKDKKEDTYYNSPSFKESNELASIPFVVFDAHKDESPELVALFLSEICTDSMQDYSFMIPYVAERFGDIITMDSKLVDITSGKFLHYGKNILCKLGLLNWTDLGDKMDEVLFERMIKGSLLQKREGLPWNSRLNLVGFLHSLTFSNLFTFSKKQLSVLIDDVLPPFLSDSNQEVRTAAKALLKVLVCIIYNEDWIGCSEKVQKYFFEAKKENTKGKINKNLYVAVSLACALVDNTYVWFSGCPEWLPAVLDLLERTYQRGDCKEEIKNSVSGFFARHHGKEIPEIEEYKYSFSEGYFT